jgi:hypothetical protein
MTSSTDAQPERQQTAREADTMPTADLSSMGNEKIGQEASHLDRPGILQTVRDDHRAVSRGSTTFYTKS